MHMRAASDNHRHKHHHHHNHHKYWSLMYLHYYFPPSSTLPHLNSDVGLEEGNINRTVSVL